MDEIVYGYCRISTPQQNIERQERNILEKFPNAYIVKEAYSGRKVVNQGKEWLKLYNQVRKDIDSSKRVTIVYDSVSRMSRNADDGVALYEELYKLGVNLVFLKEELVNTDMYRNALSNASIIRTGTDIDIILEAVEKYLIVLAKDQVRKAFEQSEKEVLDLRKRTAEGLVTARLNGKQIGRVKGSSYKTKKEIRSKELILKNSKEFNGSNTDEEVIRICGISRNTYYKYKNDLKNKQ